MRRDGPRFSFNRYAFGYSDAKPDLVAWGIVLAMLICDVIFIATK